MELHRSTRKYTEVYEGSTREATEIHRSTRKYTKVHGIWKPGVQKVTNGLPLINHNKMLLVNNPNKFYVRRVYTT